jgi:hypothetical protein
VRGLGYSDFEFFLEIDMRHTVWDQKKNSENILEKAFFYIWSGSLLKGTVAQDFLPLFFFMNRNHLGPDSYPKIFSNSVSISPNLNNSAKLNSKIF